MRRSICFLLILALLCSGTMSVFASGSNGSNEEKNYVLGLQSYLNTDNEEYLLRNENYDYWLLIEEFDSDIVMWELLNTVTQYIGGDTEPDVRKYTEVLVNIIATYDRDNAGDIAEQHKNDNMKSALDYALDVAEIGADAVDLMIDMDKSPSNLEKWIGKAISGFSTTAGNVDRWIGALSDFETIIQNYSSYDMFLALVEEKSEGNLKVAASTLRTSMEKAMKLRLDCYDNVLTENFDNYTEYFFDELFLDTLKFTDEYDSDENFKILVNSGSEFADKVGKLLNLYKGWDLGVAIGTLVGNVAVGGEDLINRLHEMMALCDIGNILCDELNEIASDYISGQHDQETAEKYFVLSNYLVGCRIRGEYCRYSIVACDSGLLSKFAYKTAEEVAKWYDEKSAKIMDIRESIALACDAILVHIESTGYEVGEISEWYIYDKSGSLCSNYTLRITSKEKMHVGAIVADDFSEPLEYVVMTPEPLLLQLDPGYWYGFEITDNSNEENVLLFTVAVEKSPDGLIEMIEIETGFGGSERLSSQEEYDQQTERYTEAEIHDKLVAHYAKGTEDASGDGLAVMKGQFDNENEYSTTVRCGVPGNPSASQMLYMIVVDATTGEVTQTFALGGTITDRQVKFNLNDSSTVEEKSGNKNIADLYIQVLDDCKSKIGYDNLPDYYQNECAGLIEDLNNDGTEELIITYPDDYENRCEIWTIKDDKAVCIFDILAGYYASEGGGGYLDLMEFQGKCYLTFFYRTVGESLEREDWIFYEMTDDGYTKKHTLQIQYSYDNVYEVPRAERYMYDGKEISENEFFELCPEKIADILNLGGEKLEEDLLNSVTSVYYNVRFMDRDILFGTLLEQLETKENVTGNAIHSVYGDFLAHKSYEKYIDSFWGNPESYAITDVDGNEIPELLIKSQYDTLTESNSFLVFSYNEDTGEIIFKEKSFFWGDQVYGDLRAEYNLFP